MTDALDIPTSDLEDKRGHKGPERRCVATGETYDKAALIRFVLSPDGVITPDITGKLPGRGVWVLSDQFALEKAIKIKAFARGFKSKADCPDDLIDMVESLLVRHMLGLLGMALKSGSLALGFDQVKAAAGAEMLAWRIEASDGSADGRGKIRVLSKAISHELELPEPLVIGCFTAEELGSAFGREHVVHASIKPGKMAKAVGIAAHRLAGFRPLVPASWPDKDHEAKRNKSRRSRD